MPQSISLTKDSLKNIHILLEGLSLKGAVSRARTKLDQKIIEAFQEVGAEERALIEENDGQILETGGVQFPFDKETKTSPKKEAYEKAQKELFDEHVIIPEHTEGQYQRLFNALNSYDQDLSGTNAVAYDQLLDALEVLNLSEGE